MRQMSILTKGEIQIWRALIKVCSEMELGELVMSRYR